MAFSRYQSCVWSIDRSKDRWPVSNYSHFTNIKPKYSGWKYCNLWSKNLHISDRAAEQRYPVPVHMLTDLVMHHVMYYSYLDTTKSSCHKIPSHGWKLCVGSTAPTPTSTYLETFLVFKVYSAVQFLWALILTRFTLEVAGWDTEVKHPHICTEDAKPWQIPALECHDCYLKLLKSVCSADGIKSFSAGRLCNDATDYFIVIIFSCSKIIVASLDW